jgi:elongation factor Tu
MQAGFSGYKPQFFFRTTDVTGVVSLPSGADMVMPGDNARVEVDLDRPIALEAGNHFAAKAAKRSAPAWCRMC